MQLKIDINHFVFNKIPITLHIYGIDLSPSALVVWIWPGGVVGGGGVGASPGGDIA